MLAGLQRKEPLWTLSLTEPLAQLQTQNLVTTWSSAIYTYLVCASIVLQGCQSLCLMLAARAQRFVCCTEAVAEGKAPVETDGKKPEPTGTKPLQAVVAEEPSPSENGSNHPQAGGVGVKVQAESINSAVKEEGPCSPPPPGKYTYQAEINPISLSKCMSTPLALPLKMLLNQALKVLVVSSHYSSSAAWQSCLFISYINQKLMDYLYFPMKNAMDFSLWSHALTYYLHFKQCSNSDMALIA